MVGDVFVDGFPVGGVNHHAKSKHDSVSKKTHTFSGPSTSATTRRSLKFVKIQMTGMYI